LKWKLRETAKSSIRGRELIKLMAPSANSRYPVCANREDNMSSDFSAGLGIPAPPALPVRTPNPKRKLYIGIGVGAAVLLLVWLFALVWFGVKLVSKGFKEPAGALDNYTSALVEKDYQRAYSLTSPEFKKETSYDALVAFHNKLDEKHGDLLNVKQTYWNSVVNNGVQTATIEATLTFSKDSAGFRFTLRKEGGVWHVLQYTELVPEAGVSQ
jgi:hypothetical protein